MTNFNLYGLLGAGLWIGVACMSLILWNSYRVAGIPALKFLFQLFLFLLYVQLPLSFYRVVFFSILPISILILPYSGIIACDSLYVSCLDSSDSFLFCLSVPIKIYENAHVQKAQILKENKGKSGVYCLTNRTNAKCYVGSSVDLRRRFCTYYSFKHLNTYLNRGQSSIYKALLKYGHSNFRLEILEYCEAADVLEREQYYLNLFKPQYNILKTAGSILGFKHSQETKRKLAEANKGKILSELTKDKMSDSKKGEENPCFGRIGENHPMFGITHTEETKAKMSAAKKGVKLSQETRAKLSYAASNKTEQHLAKTKAALGTAVVVLSLETNETTEYPSIREAARALKTSGVTISKYAQNSKIFRGSYLISNSSD